MTLATVLVADDDPLFRSALADLLSSEPGIELVGVATEAGEAIELARSKKPTVAVIDVRMPGGGGARAARGIVECSPETKIVAYSAYADRSIVLDMLRAGATSYLLKGAPAAVVVSTVLRAAQGEAVLSPEIAGGVVEELAGHMVRREREQEIERRLTDRIRQTIDERRFVCVFQPIIDLETKDQVGMEALSRFSGEPLQGPDRWFADAERAGLRVELELATAGAAVERLPDVADGGFLSINLSPVSLPSCRSLLSNGVSGRLVVEITEHAAIDDYDALSPHVATLRADGTRLAVDDAGAGFASLRHTLQLTPDFIKLDISLTRGIDTDRSRRALAAGLIGFAHELGAEIIAEGIETRDELEALRTLGVRYGQGYYIAAPGPVASVSA